MFLGHLETHIAPSNPNINVKIHARVIELPLLVYPYFELVIQQDEKMQSLAN